MIVCMSVGATERQINRVKKSIKDLGLGYKTRVLGEKKKTISIIGVTDRDELKRVLEALPGVESLISILKPYKLASREFHSEDTVISVDGRSIGKKGEIAVIAGPCAVESEEMLIKIGEIVKQTKAQFLRGALFKPRSSPYSFQGLGKRGLSILKKVKEKTGLLVVTEVMTKSQLRLVDDVVDVFQIGARNMQNFPLLKAVGRSNKPVLLKRGISATIEEWLFSAEYILAEGNSKVILCERGIRTFEGPTRFTLDISAVPVIHHLSHLPIIVDPSHASGDWKYVSSLAKAAVAAGADGLMIEIHQNPAEALSDGKQSLKLERFIQLMEDLKKY